MSLFVMNSGAIDLNDILNDISVPSIQVPEFSPFKPKPPKQLFKEKGPRKAWKANTDVARCDFAPNKQNIINRLGCSIITLWYKSKLGRTLTEIKEDDESIAFFSENMTKLIGKFIAGYIDPENWCVITTPKRRHKERNFATEVARQIAANLGIPFYEDVATARSRERINAIFDINYLPRQQNIIVFDDFVTTGHTMNSMLNLLGPLKKTLLFFAGINNHY